MKTLFIILTAVFVLSAGDHPDMKVDSLWYVYDGDTFYCTLEGRSPVIGEKVGVRLGGIDTPEIRTLRHCEKVDAKKAKQWLEDRLKYARTIILTDVEPGKFFGRVIATVVADGYNLNEELIKIGYAVPYDGGFRRRWQCK